MILRVLLLLLVVDLLLLLLLLRCMYSTGSGDASASRNPCCVIFGLSLLLLTAPLLLYLDLE